MTRKTESLSYPTNPLAAIRELQELDARPEGEPRSGGPQEPAVVALPTSSAVASATGSEESSVRRKGARRKAGGPGPGESLPGHAESGDHDPVAEAVRNMLSQPYTSDLNKGPFTVSTVKIPTEVSERLGWVAAVTKKPKQEILTEALKDYFGKMLRRG